MLYTDAMQLSVMRDEQKKASNQSKNPMFPYTSLNPNKKGKDRRSHKKKVMEALQKAGSKMEAESLKKREKARLDADRLAFLLSGTNI